MRGYRGKSINWRKNYGIPGIVQKIDEIIFLKMCKICENFLEKIGEILWEKIVQKKNLSKIKN